MASYDLNEVRCDAAAAAAVLMFIQSAASRYGGDARRWCRALWREIEKSDMLHFHLPLTYLSPRRRAEGEAATRRRCCCCFALLYFPPAVQSPRRNRDDEKRGGAVGDRRGRGCQQTWISAGDDGVTHTAAQQLDAHRGAYWRWQSFQRGSYLWNEAFSWRFEDERRLVDSSSVTCCPFSP